MKMYVPSNDRTYEQTADPAWWKDTEPCDETCHHPIHAFGHPERLRHLETTEVVLAEGQPQP